MDHNGEQRPVIECFEPIDDFFILDQLYYIDIASNCLGLIETNLDKNITTFLASCPPIKENEVLKVRSFIEENINHKIAEKIALPQAFQDIETKKITPDVRLKIYNLAINELYSAKKIIPAMDLYFQYDSKEILPQENFSTIISQKDNKITKIKRDFDFERKIKNTLDSCDFSTTRDLPYNYNFYKRPEEKGSISPYIFLDKTAYQTISNEKITEKWALFLTKIIPDFKKRGWKIEIEDGFLIDIVSPDEDWYSNIAESGSSDWFNIDIGIHVAGQKISLIPILLDLLKRRKNIFTEITKLDDTENLLVNIDSGKILQLPVGRIRDVILFLQNFLDVNHDGNGIKISRFSAGAIADLAASESATKLRFFGDKKILEIGKKLKDFRNIEIVSHPENFTAKLRNYQHDGLNWLQFLREYSLAGILADDMGLGKTIQTLAHIQYEKENNRLDKPILIIAPTSVVNNWHEEIIKITPDLNSLTLHGPKRKDKLPDLNKQDIILTSYPLLRIDQELLLSINYHSVILDEAQYIKNSKAKVTLIANQLKAKNRLCLSGTPIENHLGELWSMFNFLMPGYLGNEKTFNNIFRNPIEKQNDHQQKIILAKKVKPFLLRRTKDKILHELPKKTEIIRHIELSSKQRDLYETIRALTFEEVKTEIKKKGFARSQIKILEALLRLRQICCDPKISNLKQAKNLVDSAKMDYLMEMLPDLLEQGRSILLFSQFVSMLHLIEEECQKRKIKYVKLTGSTKDRKTPINQFQQGEVKLFLISLKAGGVGLNLTKADTVIHYDPWWNPAVETQATDRAHRIGQENPVFAYKLITTDTVEEKILIMQNKKKNLADKLFDQNSGGTEKITMEDLRDIFQK